MTLNRLFCVVLVILCAWTGYYLLQKHWQQETLTAPDNEKPIFTGTGVKNTSYNEAGIRSYRIESDTLEYYNLSGNTEFQQPVIWVYKEGTESEWRISANHATLDKEHILQMSGNVRIFNLLPDSAINAIKTDTLRLDLISKDFDTPDPVTITGSAFQNEGIGMKGNMERSVATLMNNVKGRYEALQN
ncbi:LPS export ABC transporter periplasmic protein LptC [Photobacterium salinisoli]|uniref:LPS export ABC transporter periplasmic protein LptC n=1 Tax=Photobacterium salinisoli TaxID=1616783 RepID=UPI000EA26B23|nr:LPS export ABC transporter periplasmic protein LptC [Photobacterium salinisoli]